MPGFGISIVRRSGVEKIRLTIDRPLRAGLDINIQHSIADTEASGNPCFGKLDYLEMNPVVYFAVERLVDSAAESVAELLRHAQLSGPL